MLQRMKHGSDNESNVIATLTSMIMPFLYPRLCYVEVGSYVINSTESNTPHILVSPDGMLCTQTHNPLHKEPPLYAFRIQMSHTWEI